MLTPSSKLTFAALWDPETGISAFQDGKPVKLSDGKNHTKWPSVAATNQLHTKSLPPPPKTPMALNIADFDYTRPGLYLPRTSAPCYGFKSPVPSSTLEGKHDPWNYSFFDPLRPHPPFDPARPFSKFAYLQNSNGTSTSHSEAKPIFGERPTSVEDEGFFDGYDHPDCEPHLVSSQRVHTECMSLIIL